MWKSFYEGHALLELPLFAMGLFILAFVVAVGRAWLKNGKDDPLGRLPLDENLPMKSLNASDRSET